MLRRVGMRSSRGRRVALLTSASVLVASLHGCGKSSRSLPVDPTTSESAGNGSESSGGGDDVAAASGRGPENEAGTAHAGSASQSMGGSGDDQPPSAAGAGDAGAPADCGPTPERCFEPCGGDRSGNWVLEEACFRGGTVAGCQGGRVAGTARDLRMSMTIGDEYDGSLPVRISGQATWEIVANVPPSCLGVDAFPSCGQAQLFLGPTGPRHSATSREWLPTCKPSACGDCECTATTNDTVVIDRTTPYCANGDVLWVGGEGKNGEPKVSYKFRRRSCISTGSAQCNFTTCEETPGCSLGTPLPPHCAGEPNCGGIFTADDCHEPGCSLGSCWGGGDPVPCEDLYQSLCALAPGCVWSGQRCTGTTYCGVQTSDEACQLLPYCDPLTHCAGTPTRACSSLSVADCHSLYGCVVEW